MRITCEKCRTQYEVRDELAGRISRCRCGARIVLPIDDPARLFDWACKTTYRSLFRFVTSGGARGHSRSTVDRLIRIFEERRWNEECKARGQREQQRAIEAETKRIRLRQEELRRIKNSLASNRRLEQLIRLTPGAFEILVSDVFRMQGFQAFPVGRSNDGGVDVEIREQKKQELWGVAQCKRYVGAKIGAKHIREFAGAMQLAKAPRGFYVTTSRFTKQAIEAARRYEGVTTYDGVQFARLVESLCADGRNTNLSI